ncbi:MAG TPA: hypothetical protein VNA16_03100, partial [Abditibacteriaceae bacterium]|nr:hypothetical protein [Abditibacteriaceae bacterium]
MKLQRNSLIGALALWTIVGMGQAAHAQPAVGVIDEAKLGQEYKKYKDAMDANEKKADAVEGKLSARELLTEAEGKQFDELILKKSPSAGENGTLDKLVAAGTARRAEYVG